MKLTTAALLAVSVTLGSTLGAVAASKTAPDLVRDVTARIANAVNIEQVVPNAIVVQTIREMGEFEVPVFSWNLNTWGRANVMSSHLDGILRGAVKTPKDDQDNVYFIKYAAWSAGEWWWKHNYETLGVTFRIYEPLEAYREGLMEGLRERLKDPEVLWAEYESRKLAVVLAMEENPTKWITYLTTAKATAAAYQDPQHPFSILHTTRRIAEQVWWDYERNDEDGRQAAFSIYYDVEEEMNAYARAEGLEVYMMLALDRRHSEGGDELVATYGRIVDDLLTTLNEDWHKG